MSLLSRLLHLVHQRKVFIARAGPTHWLLACMLSDYGVHLYNGSEHLYNGSEGDREIICRNGKHPG